MFLKGQHFADTAIFEYCTGRLHLIHLGDTRGHSARDFLGIRDPHRHKRREPFERELHSAKYGAIRVRAKVDKALPHHRFILRVLATPASPE